MLKQFWVWLHVAAAVPFAWFVSEGWLIAGASTFLDRAFALYLGALSLGLVLLGISYLLWSGWCWVWDDRPAGAMRQFLERLHVAATVPFAWLVWNGLPIGSFGEFTGLALGAYIPALMCGMVLLGILLALRGIFAGLRDAWFRLWQG